MVQLGWKAGRIVPLHKPGKTPLEPSSYHTIALARCVGKMVGRMILVRLQWYLKYHDVYRDAMERSRRGRSSTDNVIDQIMYVEY